MKDIIKLHDRKFKIMIPAEKIDEAVSAVAQRINEDYGDKETPLFVGVLNGSFMFMSDLIKKIEFNNELSFVKLASYEYFSMLSSSSFFFSLRTLFLTKKDK